MLKRSAQVASQSGSSLLGGAQLHAFLIFKSDPSPRKEQNEGSRFKLLTRSARSTYVGEDRSLMVKISLAKSTGSLDLSWLGLKEVPEEIFELPDLEVLTLAGNQLKTLPGRIAQFTSLRQLQAAGNMISSLPPEITQLQELEEVWFHGNLLEELPSNFGNLHRIKKLSLAGNRLTKLPGSMASLVHLEDLSLSGNLLEELPDWFGNFEKLTTLSLNGNRIKRLAEEIGNCTALRFLSLQTNALSELPQSITRLKAVEELNVSDNSLESVPESWRTLEACKLIWMYGNCIRRLPADILQLPKLECIWMEGNPFDQEQLKQQLESHHGQRPLREIGLDHAQVQGLSIGLSDRLWGRVRIGESLQRGHGYFNLRRAAPFSPNSPLRTIQKVLVVTFASAPGTPNWGGVLSRIISEATPEEQAFDILYVCDGGRNWYSAGDDGLSYWRERLSDVTQGYDRVLLLGDSMGATAALLFSDLATSVQVFTPQVNLAEASMRPGQPQQWLKQIKHRILCSVEASTATIDCHCGTWDHDLQQVKLLPSSKCNLVVHHVDSHRLAFALNRQNKLLPIIRGAILRELGLYRPPRLANLL